jgi:prepilin-type N-terminal cleavage/methylation domain-containing protein
MSIRAFTLIELLVVITIIAVLLALLTPALDRATYQADLAVCAARLDSIALGVSVYAMENQRTYPQRVTAVGQLRPMVVHYGGTSGQFDDRPRLVEHVGLRTLVDPLVRLIDLSEEANDDNTAVLASYCLWFGWRIIDGKGSKGLRRIGDLLEYDDGVRKYRFNILASDADSVQTGWGFSQASHPDPGGPYMGFVQNQNSFTYAFWTHTDSRNKGPIDRQFVAADGSVQRLSGLKIQADGEPDERLVAVPGVADLSTNARLKEHLPSQ